METWNFQSMHWQLQRLIGETQDAIAKKVAEVLKSLRGKMVTIIFQDGEQTGEVQEIYCDPGNQKCSSVTINPPGSRGVILLLDIQGIRQT